MKPVLLIADSRGRNLDSSFLGLTDCEVTVAVYPGADILTSITRANALLNRCDWSQIYILSGICNVTYKDKKTKKLYLRIQDPQQLLTYFQELLVSAFGKLTSTVTNTSTNCKFIFAPLTGIDLAKYNKSKIDSNQELLNNCIEMINLEIASFNREKKVFTPWTSHIVHHRSRGKYHTRYEKLTTDGCHLTPCVIEYWAQSIAEAIDKNS